MLPNHVGVILDGNRRFAKQLMKSAWLGHKYGLQKALDVLRWSCEAGIKYVTAYTLSLENLSTRPKKELRMILKYLESEIDNVSSNADHVIHEFNINVRFIGRTHLLPLHLQKKMKTLEKMTRRYNKHYLNVAVAYGGQQEIVDAVKKIVQKGLKGIIRPSDINEKILKEHLWTNGQPEPDMIFRTGGEKRLSNFLPYQSVYSELFFVDKKWPEIKKKDFMNAVKDYDKRKRRFGS